MTIENTGIQNNANTEKLADSNKPSAVDHLSEKISNISLKANGVDPSTPTSVVIVEAYVPPHRRNNTAPTETSSHPNSNNKQQPLPPCPPNNNTNSISRDSSSQPLPLQPPNTRNRPLYSSQQQRSPSSHPLSSYSSHSQNGSYHSSQPPSLSHGSGPNNGGHYYDYNNKNGYRNYNNNQNNDSYSKDRPRYSRNLPFNGYRKPDDDEFADRPDVAPRNLNYENTLYGSIKENTTGINFDKYGDIPIEVSGNDVPKMVDSFSESDLDKLALFNINLSGYTVPTPVQKYSTSIIHARRDLMACAQTGSGKTAAFLVPILSLNFKLGTDREFLAARKASLAPSPNNRHSRVVRPVTVILAPTRELAIQIYQEARKFSYRSWVRPCVVYGGQNIYDQIKDLDRGCDMLVATPGRLIDHVNRGKVSLDLVKFLVLDEADKMLDMGFEPQIRRIAQKENMPPTGVRQTLMFSATFPPNIQNLAKEFLNDYVFLTVGRVGSTSEDIRQTILPIGQMDKCSSLLNIIKSDISENNEPGKKPKLTLCFVETKRSAENICSFLIDNGIPATSIHGDRCQDERRYALNSFRSGRTPVLVATAVASRGLDIPNVSHVINFDLPADIDDYVHRIGRTGRAGNTGRATAFFDVEHDRPLSKSLIQLLREARQDCPAWLETLKTQAERESAFKNSYQRRSNNRSFNNNNFYTSSYGNGYRTGGPDDYVQDAFSMGKFNHNSPFKRDMTYSMTNGVGTARPFAVSVQDSNSAPDGNIYKNNGTMEWL